MSVPSLTSHQFSRAGWWMLIVLALSLVFLLIAAGYPVWRQIAFIRQIEGMGGEVYTVPRAPMWLSRRPDAPDSPVVRGFDKITSISGPAVDDQLLQRLAEFPEIQHVSVNGPAVTHIGISALAHHANLFHVDLFESHLDDAGMEELSHLPILESIAAGYTDLTDAGLVYAGRMTQLSYLGLRGNKITDSGLAHLARLKNLLGLHLGETQITDAGLVHLVGMRDLREVWLNHTATTEAGVLQFVADHPQLKELVISDQITADGMDELHRRFPDLKVQIRIEEHDGSNFSRRRRR